jgi:hypothetical protein
MNRSIQSIGFSWSDGFWIVGGCAAIVVLVFARLNVLTFPYPRVDEVRFFLPSFSLATRHTLSTPLLNAPYGIFWVPDGLYLWLAAPLRVFGANIQNARNVCEITVAFAVLVWAFLFRLLVRSRWLATAITFVLVAPPSLLAANEVRMEAPILLLFGIAMLLHILCKPLAAIAILMLALLFHPIVALSIVGYLMSLAIASRLKSQAEKCRAVAPFTYVLCFATVLAIAIEAVHMGSHWSLMSQQMSFQVQRKVGRPLFPFFMKPQAALLGMELCAAAWIVVSGLKGERGKMLALLMPLIGAGLGLQFAAVVGGEMNYDVYSLTAIPALFLAIAGRFWGPSTSEDPGVIV